MTRPELVKSPEPAASPDASSQPASQEQSGKAGSAEHASTRPARGRGEPRRHASPSRPSGALPEPEQSPALPSAATPAAPSALLSAPDDELTEDSGLEYPSSRLSGLRTLLMSLGRRSLDQEKDAGAEPEPGMEARFQRSAPRPAYANSNAYEDSVPASGAPARLTAQPEFLPPRPLVEAEAEREKEAVRPAPTRRDTPESEEIQTLPSWRGQYRKKRYPPI